MDDVTTYYLLHRHDFRMADAPVGACILYALSCNLSDAALVNQHDLLSQSGAGSADEAPEAEDAEEAESGGGAKVKLKPWQRRQGGATSVLKRRADNRCRSSTKCTS